MPDLSLTAIGKDRPGIVAAVTGVLYRLGCNLAGCSMTRLGGQFAMIMLVEIPGSLSKAELEVALQAPASKLGLAVHLHDADRAAAPAVLRPHVISLYGADHPGIVYRIAEELAGREVNVTDLMSKIVGEDIYTVILNVDLPEDLDVHRLRSDLESAARELGVELSLRAEDSDELL